MSRTASRNCSGESGGRAGDIPLRVPRTVAASMRDEIAERFRAVLLHEEIVHGCRRSRPAAGRADLNVLEVGAYREEGSPIPEHDYGPDARQGYRFAARWYGLKHGG